MTPERAEEILKKYLSLIKETEGQFARDEALLPAQQEEIREAHFVRIEELVKNATPYAEIEPLINSFTRLAQFKDAATADRLMKINASYNNVATRLLIPFHYSANDRNEYYDFFESDYFGWDEMVKVLEYLEQRYRTYQEDHPGITRGEGQLAALKRFHHDFIAVSSPRVMMKLLRTQYALFSTGVALAAFFGVWEQEFVFTFLFIALYLQAGHLCTMYVVRAAKRFFVTWRYVREEKALARASA